MLISRDRLSLRAETDDSDGVIRRDHSHSRVFIAVGIGALAIGLVVASLAVLYPYLEENFFGPAPQWHTFNSVLGGTGQLASESCTLKDLQQILQGVGGVGKATPTSVMECSFHGSTYVGYYGRDCNSSPTGVPSIVNGTTVPYEGCVLGQAPLNHTFAGIFGLGPRVNNSIVVYSDNKAVANLTFTLAWRSFACSLVTDNLTKSNGPLKCYLSGVRYVAADVLQSCDISRSVVVAGSAIPSGSCNLERADLVGAGA